MHFPSSNISPRTIEMVKKGKGAGSESGMLKRRTYTFLLMLSQEPTRFVLLASTMHPFRNKSSPVATPPPTPASSTVEHIKQELATFRPRAKDGGALAASSSAIALSIASQFCDPTDVALNEPGSSKESVWKAAYGAARMAVDVAKDSSDMLPPLKAVMVALSVLIENYDVGPHPG